tara:strand:+ start:5100 stop:5603 length:504 start_codon:yes stop_codon:yes gene_type:complete
MKKKTIEIPLLPRAKWDLKIAGDSDWKESDAMNDALREQTMMFLQAYADHVTEGNPASALDQFIYWTYEVWNLDIQETVYHTLIEPTEPCSDNCEKCGTRLPNYQRCDLCGAKHWITEMLGWKRKDLVNGSTEEAKEFKAKAKQYLKESRYEKVVQIKPEIKIKDMS